ncbi:MAG: hypothetical protein V8R55_14235 [Dysosmobacter sp.]
MDDKNGAVWMSTAKVQRGYLESSNADLATELTGVIEGPALLQLRAENGDHSG